ncbi:UDP-glucuronosyl/UDP-glucosyltransferase protein [Dioscorea alata]|uniref:UDP-glucuronosyl/UDP-glucosyltransferase protein n=2 Tax=Dioscorea alata TaxID=55571 RepID=A0ACB7UAN1_DIOAL|nr:UDP-glucuronosyl/UDP-glucosyltransferase protein [Dioscorea alata]KAH7657384.1 UDP-glucuronosyl/UDP-glucosyltransferase protein [Dioscorea alata]
MAGESRRARALFMAFGTKGDVLPIAAIAAALARDQLQYQVLFITHLAHRSISDRLEGIGVSFVPISSPPVVPAAVLDDSESLSFSMRKKVIRDEHRKECLFAIERVFGDGPSLEGDFIVINLFALEGWSLAELFQVRCVVAAPYVVPYSAPSSFEHRFRQELPLLYKYFQEAPANKVCWNDVTHWMWPLFTEEWGSWRSDCLNLSPFPFTDPVTNLPMWHVREESPLLLYGFSKEIVECPGYWPSNSRVCGFWFLPMEWQFSCDKCREIIFSNLSSYKLCVNHADLQNFILEPSGPCKLIFVGLSSIGSMGYLTNPRAFLLVLKAVVEITNHKVVLFSAGYEPLDALIRSSSEQEQLTGSEDGISLFNNRLFCFSGCIPYSWLFPNCAVAIHHGGSGSTAAALHAGIPQILCPFLLDQFYWAERLCWLGVAPTPLQKQHLVPDSDDATSIQLAADALSKAITTALSCEIKEQATTIARRISREDGVREVLKVLKEEVIWSGEQKS